MFLPLSPVRHYRFQVTAGALITREILREEKPPFSQNTSMTLKASAMTIHPIINGRDQSTSDALLAKRPNVNVMFNIHPHFFVNLLDYVQPRRSNVLS